VCRNRDGQIGLRIIKGSGLRIYRMEMDCHCLQIHKERINAVDWIETVCYESEKVDHAYSIFFFRNS